MVSPLKAAIVGTGEQGGYHAAAYSAAADTELVAACDLDRDRAVRLAAAHGLDPDRAYTSVAALAADHAPDVWSVCTPPGAHAANVAELVALDPAPAAILCEKPPCLTWAEFEDMTDQAARRGVVLVFGLHLRFTGARWLRRVVASGRIGQPYHVAVDWTRRGGIPARGVFTRREHSGGGPGMDLLPHTLDLGLALAGPTARPLSVSALVHDHIARAGGSLGLLDPAGIDVEDAMVGLVTLDVPALDRPASLTFSTSWDAHVAGDRVTVEVLGTAGGARLTLRREHGREWLDPTVHTVLDGAPVDIAPAGSPSQLAIDECYRAQVDAIAAALRARPAGGPPADLGDLADVDQAGRMLRVALAAYASAAANGAPVSITNA